jgi:hypothetical protein
MCEVACVLGVGLATGEEAAGTLQHWYMLTYKPGIDTFRKHALLVRSSPHNIYAFHSPL